MREIKFRGKRVDNGEWMYGNPVEWLNETKDISIVAHPFGCCIDEKGNLVLIEAPFVCKIIPETIGQFTGLHDKNGKEIYEGDIVTYPDASSCGDSGEWDCFTNMGVVDYCVNTMSYYFTNRVSVDMDEIDIEVEVEIIGNIHDNPELLKEVSHEA